MVCWNGQDHMNFIFYSTCTASSDFLKTLASQEENCLSAFVSNWASCLWMSSRYLTWSVMEVAIDPWTTNTKELQVKPVCVGVGGGEGGEVCVWGGGLYECACYGGCVWVCVCCGGGGSGCVCVCVSDVHVKTFLKALVYMTLWFLLLLLRSPAMYLGFTILGEILLMWPFLIQPLRSSHSIFVDVCGLI